MSKLDRLTLSADNDMVADML